jgi:hypothetical protein
LIFMMMPKSAGASLSAPARPLAASLKPGPIAEAEARVDV